MFDGIFKVQANIARILIQIGFEQATSEQVVLVGGGVGETLSSKLSLFTHFFRILPLGSESLG